MSLTRTLLLLAAALLLQAGLGRIWPGLHRYTEFLLVPVVVAAIVGSGRAGMFTGCAAGLWHDAWFEAAAFGIGGVRWTFLGWALGVINTWVDLHNPAGRLAAGFLMGVADALLDPLLRGLLDQSVQVAGPFPILTLGAVTGLLSALVGSIVEGAGRAGGRPIRRYS